MDTCSTSGSRATVRRSSSSSSRGDLFGAILARGPVASATADEAWLEALLAVEVALARAQARVGLIAEAHADAIEQACRSSAFDLEVIGREAAAAGNPVIPLVRLIREAVGGAAADEVHRGATSQDILDSAAMLVARRSVDHILGDLGRAAEAAAHLAATQRGTIMVARTLLQQALPTTFGLKAAGWMIGLDEAADGLLHVRDRRLAVQLGGAAGTMAALGPDGPALVAAFATELDLVEPALPWHTQRNRVGELASALGIAAGALAKPARDMVLLAQTEVGEVHEGVAGRGGSSTLPNKRNPVAAISALAAAHQAPGLVATLLGTMTQEHERAAGAWHAEWTPLRSLLVATGSAAAWLADATEHLVVDEGAMQANLDRAGGGLLAERIVDALAAPIGRQAAADLVGSTARNAAGAGDGFGAVLRSRVAERKELAAIDLDVLLDPRGYLGSADVLVERALALHRGRGAPR
jgi:3-carboxy-cis,cis-muconate cycloisomerase